MNSTEVRFNKIVPEELLVRFNKIVPEELLVWYASLNKSDKINVLGIFILGSIDGINQLEDI